MAVTDAQFSEWLSDGRNRRVLLAEISAHDGANQITLYMSNTGFVSAPADTPANTAYPSIISGVPEFSADRSGSQNWGTLDIRNSGAFDAWLQYGFGGQQILLGLGDPSWPRSDFRFVTLALSKQGIEAPDNNHLRFYFYDAGGEIDAPVQTNILTNGDPIPLCYGTVFNCEPAYLGEDASGALYQVHDGAIDSITVRSGGLAATGVTATLSAGTFWINPAPTGRVTCDVVNTSTASTLADVVGEIITGQMGLTGRLDTASFSAFDAAMPYPVGLYIKERANAREVINALLAPLSAYCTASITGNFRLWLATAPLAIDTAVETIDYRGYIARHGLSLSSSETPISAIRMGYQRNHSTQDKDALFGAVPADDRELYSREYSIHEASQTLAKFPYALEYPDGIRGTAIVSIADAETEAARVLAEHEKNLQLFSINAFADAINIKLGDVIEVIHPRFGFDNGRKGRIVGLRWNPTRRRCTIDIIGEVVEQANIFTEEFSTEFS